MNSSATSRRFVRLSALCALACGTLVLTGCGPQAAPAAAAKPKADAAKTGPATVPTPIGGDQFASVFETELQPPTGRDPFFPYSHRRDPVISPTSTTPMIIDPSLELKTIIHGRAHSQAVINNSILEVGEEGAIRVPNGKVRVQCLEIGADYVLVRVQGDGEVKRLMMEKKK